MDARQEKLRDLSTRKKKKTAAEAVAATGATPQDNYVVFQHHDTLRKLENQNFNKYYRDIQKIVPTESWDSFAASLREPLPTTLWINDTDPLAPEVSRYFQSLDPASVQPISWYPIPGMAWRVLVDKATFRKRPDLQTLRQYLIKQTELGTISRQEEVSMIPPFMLQIQPSDVCLDMCASPGSKTAQMLVALGRHKQVPFESDRSLFPFDYLSEGVIMANELDTKRANMLVHQVKRMRLLFPFALFTNHDARYFPDVNLPTYGGSAEADVPTTPLRFDKILCDVVCSGDGTLRKAPYMFKGWSPREALSLQATQVHIALRACHLLKIGGRLVYSTCSLNPIENEAVVCQIVSRTNGAMKLVDGRTIMPTLPCSPGLTTWSVTNAKCEIIPAPTEHFHEALFPPTTPIEGLDLTQCMRLLPEHCNGGGFFIAIFDKVAPFEITKKDPSLVATEGGAAPSDRPKRGKVTSITPSVMKRARKEVHEESEKPVSEEQQGDVEGMSAVGSETSNTLAPHVEKVPPQFFSATDDMVKSLTEFYKLPAFPTANLVARGRNNERTFTLGLNSTATLVSNTTRHILQHKTDALIVVSAGLRVLAHEHLDKGWRIASEAASLFAKLMQGSERMLKVKDSFVERLMEGGKLKDVLIPEIEDAELRAKVEALSVGTVFLEVDCPQAPGGVVYTVALRARSRMQLLVDHEDLVGLRLRMGLGMANCAALSDE